MATWTCPTCGRPCLASVLDAAGIERRHRKICPGAPPRDEQQQLATAPTRRMARHVAAVVALAVLAVATPIVAIKVGDGGGWFRFWFGLAICAVVGAWLAAELRTDP